MLPGILTCCYVLACSPDRWATLLLCMNRLEQSPLRPSKLPVHVSVIDLSITWPCSMLYSNADAVLLASA